MNCAWNVRSCPTCWCPDDDLTRTDKTSPVLQVHFAPSKRKAPPRIPAGRVALMTWKQLLCFSALSRSSSCRRQGRWIVPPPSCTSRPLLLSCTLLPANLCLAGCHSFPVSCKATLLPPYLTSCGHLKAGAFQYGIADAAAVDGRRGSNVYEVKPWLWQFGRGGLAWGSVSV